MSAAPGRARSSTPTSTPTLSGSSVGEPVAEASVVKRPRSNTVTRVSPPFPTSLPEAQTISSAPLHPYTSSKPRANAVLSPPPIPTYSPANYSSRVPSGRVVSGPSSLPRPKTPERKSAVFKARTPERRLAALETENIPLTTSAGKKRRAPDDFEECESVPPQGFTADCLPGDDIENNTTPRLRRVMQSFATGFTPVRSQFTRPTIPMPSPKRPTTFGSPFFAEVTNSPRVTSQPMGMPSQSASAKPSKRSWLGKIKGSSSSSSQQLPPTTRVSSRVFERVPAELS